MRRDRAGFTLIELIVVAVLGALVASGAFQVLVTTQRTFTAQAATIAGQQSTRMALDVLFNEFREVSATGGDILVRSSDSVTVRLMRKWGYVCATDFTIPALTVVPWGTGTNAFALNDSVFTYADNDEDIAYDDAWIPAQITAVTPSVCPQNGAAAQMLSFLGQDALFAADSVGVGAPVRSFREFTFGPTTYYGDTYLGRREGGGAMVPVAGPVSPTNGVEFVFRDAQGAVTAASDSIRQIEVVVRTSSSVLGPGGGVISDSISAWIYTRNSP